MQRVPRNKRNGRRRGFTLVEAIVVVVIIGILSAVIAPRIIQNISRSKQAQARANIAALRTAVDQYRVNTGMSLQPTDTLRVILWEGPPNAPDSWEQGINNEDALFDPWGREYILIIPGRRSVDYDIVSYGRDGREGGSGEDADIVG